MSQTQNLLDEREKTHGNFSRVSKTTQTMLGAIRSGESYCFLSDIQREALHMVCSKIARITNGDPNFQDHWDDAIGYLTLARDQNEIPNS